ncbi:hypothetical protein [Flocculibacter collagenilyticus]|uniref:hypothetical protein n=1 Tax=Flocculibacter collagenilyticus TaxID=2744479 RepID=UPI0018F3B115|nr:hypothetical protein [Flocculibacter collagenilyticus]
MSVKAKVLLVGWEPDAVDYSKWPGLTPQKLRAALEGDKDKMNAMGYEAKLGLITGEDAATDDLSGFLSENDYDCVLIGAGVRTIDEYLLLFEKLINTIHSQAPNAKICFNTGPFDSVDAVQRWV